MQSLKRTHASSVQLLLAEDVSMRIPWPPTAPSLVLTPSDYPCMVLGPLSVD